MSVVIEDKARIPIRPLSYEHKELAMAKELIIDYKNYAAYVKTENGEIHNVSASDAAISAILEHIQTHPEIITSAKVSRSDGTLISISGAINDIYSILSTAIKIDPTLKISGKAADAKVVGDALAKKSNTGHKHTTSEITNFTSSLETHIKNNPTIVTDRTVLNGNSESVTISAAISDLYGLIKQAVSGSVAIDSTLSKSGFAADSKTVGDKLKEKSNIGHEHAIANVTGLQNALDGKAPASHTHSMSNITGLNNALSGKAPSVHSHTSDDITDLSDLLDKKANSSHTHTSADITDLQSKLNGKANSSHTHTMTQINGLSDALAKKSDTGHTHNYAGSSSAGGPATSALKLSNSRTIAVTLNGIAGAVAFNGSNNITIGADGILPINKGGTGSSDPEIALSNLGGAAKAEIDNLQNQIDEKAPIYHSHNYAGSALPGGSATSAVKLQTARSVKVNLASTSASNFDGSAHITPGVSGILPIENGGTGKSTVSEARSALGAASASDLSSLSTKVNGLKYAGSGSAGGSATSAVKLQTARSVKVNLASTSASNFDGSANITPGVSGALPIANGGTGKTTVGEARSALGAASSSDLSSLSTKVNGLKYAGASTAGGAAASAVKLQTARSVKVNLASTSASNFDGSANITPGVSGILPIANGGTGASSKSSALNALGGMPNIVDSTTSHLWAVFSENPYLMETVSTNYITLDGYKGVYETYPTVSIRNNIGLTVDSNDSICQTARLVMNVSIVNVDTVKRIFKDYPFSYLNTIEYGYIAIDSGIIISNIEKNPNGDVKVNFNSSYNIHKFKSRGKTITVKYVISRFDPSSLSEYAQLVY